MKHNLIVNLITTIDTATNLIEQNILWEKKSSNLFYLKIIIEKK